jgi:hypothetical protein
VSASGTQGAEVIGPTCGRSSSQLPTGCKIFDYSLLAGKRGAGWRADAPALSTDHLLANRLWIANSRAGEIEYTCFLATAGRELEGRQDRARVANSKADKIALADRKLEGKADGIDRM